MAAPAVTVGVSFAPSIVKVAVTCESAAPSVTWTVNASLLPTSVDLSAWVAALVLSSSYETTPVETVKVALP